jgi:hypothetical protein
MGLGLRLGLSFKVYELGIRVYDYKFEVRGPGFSVQGFMCGIQVSGVKFGFRVKCLGFSVQGLVSRV